MSVVDSHRFLLLVAVAFPLCSTSRHATGTESGNAQFVSLQSLYHRQLTDHYERIKQAKNKDDRERLSHLHPANTTIDDFLRFEARHRGELVGLSALHHLVSIAGGGYGFAPEYNATQGGRQAIEILTSHYGDNPSLDLFFRWLQPGSCSKHCRLLLRRALESPHRHIRGNALFALARFSALEAEFVISTDAEIDLLKSDSQASKQVKVLRELREQYGDVDGSASHTEALRLLDRVVTEYGDVLASPRTTFGPVLLSVEDRPVDSGRKSSQLKLAANSLRFQLLNLSIGQTAPEIEGPDAFGKQLSLGGQRGNVTVLMFSFKGCGPCEAMYPANRELIEQYRGRPFSFLGVMGDDEVSTVKDACDAGKITWPVWWDGGRPGPIAQRWNVTGWPQIYVIDHLGVIRYRPWDSEFLARAVAELIRDAEAKASR